MSVGPIEIIFYESETYNDQLLTRLVTSGRLHFSIQ